MVEESHLLALTVELRNKICELVLGTGECYVREMRNEYRDERISPALLRASAQTLPEARPIFHQDNSFHLIAEFFTSPGLGLANLSNFDISTVIATQCTSMSDVTFEFRVLWSCPQNKIMPSKQLQVWLEGGELDGGAALQHRLGCAHEDAFQRFLKELDRDFERIYRDAAAVFAATKVDLVVHPLE